MSMTIHGEVSSLAGHTVIVKDKGLIEIADWFDRITGVDFDGEGEVLFGYHVYTGQPYAFFVEEIVAQ